MPSRRGWSRRGTHASKDDHPSPSHQLCGHHYDSSFFRLAERGPNWTLTRLGDVLENVHSENPTSTHLSEKTRKRWPGILSNILDRNPPPFDVRIRYGNDHSQFSDLRFPSGKGPFPLLFVVHGGFWQSRYDLSHAGHLCAALTSKGVITCNVEYRRIGNPGGGWPGTFQDISLANP